MGDVISLAAYRSGLRCEGTTLVWRELRHTLEGPAVREFCEALDWANDDGHSWIAAGFRIWADRRFVYVSGWDMGPMTMRRGDEVRRLGIRLMKAERARRGAEGPVSA
jgi:hypothetical protein